MNKLIYFASPYTHDDYMVQVDRFETMRAIVAEIFVQQSVIFPYSPIVYSHDLDSYIERVDNTGFDWVERDKTILEKCDGMVVVTMDGWKESVGVQEEIKFCEENDIPITYMHPSEVHDFIMQFVRHKFEDDVQNMVEALNPDEVEVRKIPGGSQVVEMKNIKP